MVESLLQITLWTIFVLSVIVLYYISGRKKRKLPYYINRDLTWKTIKREENEKIAYSVFLIGDAGAPSLKKTEPTLQVLKGQLDAAGENSGVFFLGDNIYPKGMPLPDDPMYAIAEKRLIEQLKILKDYKGKAVFLSGNHDWNKGRRGGFETMMRQQHYVDNYLGNQDSYLPRDGCPGPVELNVADFLTIIIINSQWWVQSGVKPIGKKCGCIVDNEHEFFVELQAILKKNKDKKIVVLGHHPMYSKAYHGGRFDIKQHLFPLTELNKKMYVPLPVVGSIYPMYRRYIGAKEDMSHPKYRNLRKRLIDIFKEYDNLVYAAGHDHNLQYIRKHKQHYIVSGAGCKTTFVQKGAGALFTHAHKGFFRLDYYKNGELWLEVWEPAEGNDSGLLAYRKEIMNVVGLQGS